MPESYERVCVCVYQMERHHGWSVAPAALRHLNHVCVHSDWYMSAQNNFFESRTCTRVGVTLSMSQRFRAISQSPGQENSDFVGTQEMKERKITAD